MNIDFLNITEEQAELHKLEAEIKERRRELKQEQDMSRTKFLHNLAIKFASDMDDPFIRESYISDIGYSHEFTEFVNRGGLGFSSAHNIAQREYNRARQEMNRQLVNFARDNPTKFADKIAKYASIRVSKVAKRAHTLRRTEARRLEFAPEE